MFKFLTLAAAVAILPLSEKFFKCYSDAILKTAYIFPYKNNIPAYFFQAEKNQTESWSRNWMAAAQENIRKSEYNFKWEETLDAYCTPNRKNDLRFFYDDQGFSVEPRTTMIPVNNFDAPVPPGVIRYRPACNWKANFSLDKRQVGKGFWKTAANKAEYITDKVTVQYINNDDGMRQNFIVHSPLSKTGFLKINLRIKTNLKTRLSDNQLQFFHKKRNVLNYEDLKVWDATGKSLAARFQKIHKGSYYIQVDIKDAVYPITIDPISTSPAAIIESNQVNANMGYAVATAGDVNGDGYSDVIAGAHGYDNGETNEGAAFVYHGSATGISTTAAAMVESNQANARMGLSVATAGDVNGDGYSDIIVGAGLYSNGEASEGAAFIYHGSATGINTTAATRLESNQVNAQMGLSNSVACAGDVNNDGYSDVIVGAWLYDNGETNEGVAFVYHGSASGISGTIATTLEANQGAANFGLAVACAGDVNGDGYSDVIVGAEDYDNGNTDEGVAFIYHGSATGINNTAVTMMESDQDLCQYGYAVASAGDVNGDGYSDVIVGAYLYDNGQTNEGAAFVYHGSAAGIANTVMSSLESNQGGAQLGCSVASAGDINGDGYSDVIVGANQYDNGESNEGGAFVCYGAVGGIDVTATILESNQAGAGLGNSVTSAGDVNGDGYSDVIAGAYAYNNGGQPGEGGAFVFHGAAAGLGTSATMVECNQVNASFGSSVCGAGDVNADGFSDVIVGAQGFDNGEADEGVAFIFHGSAFGISATPSAMVESNQAATNFGYAVAGAGDVNADGYADVIVGAWLYDNGQTNEGAAFVYHGSPTGINTVAATIIESNQASAFIGSSVAGAGDVNGDGYGDVIVGAFGYDNGQAEEGGAFVYHGSPTGINNVYVRRLEANQAFSGFGNVAGAGDVNGDGYADVVVGAPGFDNGESDEGAAFVYHGSATGINSTAAGILQSNQVSANLGIYVAGAGDVNADGYSDVIVSAPNYDNGETDEGVAFIHHGSSTGINTTAAVMLEPNQATAAFGYSVAGAGDVNGDGYADVVVGSYNYDNGETNEGAFFIYHGSPTGTSPSAAVMIESNRAFSVFGYSVASAGDVNGDGYSDVVAGAYNYNNGESGEGASFIYRGNGSGLNKRNNLRLYNTNLVTPINSSNFILSNFGAGLYGKSFLGRDSGKIVWETRLNYNAYSGTPITNSTLYTSEQTSYTDMALSGIEMKSLVTKLLGGKYTKLRARVRYNPLKAITGQVYGPWRNVSNIIDANHLGILPIELISFNAAWLQKGKIARLDLKTDKESGICCFDMEKSNDGFNFYYIGTVQAKNIPGVQSYSFIDANATGRDQFYRIKIKAITGQYHYSNIQHLQNDKATEILVFPNPTTNVLQLQLNTPADRVNVLVINSGGQLVKKLTVPALNQTITIPVQNLAAGKYWLHLQTADEKQVLQFVKQ